LVVVNFFKNVLADLRKAGIVVLDMNNTASQKLVRILSNKFPELNPKDGCYCYDLAERNDLDGIVDYGLGWWMGQAEDRQAEVNRLKAELEALKQGKGA
jgi:hypothetical protein